MGALSRTLYAAVHQVKINLNRLGKMGRENVLLNANWIIKEIV